MDSLLVSTDIGSDIDDALALLVMLNHPCVRLEGVYTVYGDTDSRSYIAKRIVDLAGKMIPVGRGISESLAGISRDVYNSLVSHLVDDSFIDTERMDEEDPFDVIFRPFSVVGIIPDGIVHMAAQLLEEPRVVFSLGPLTNIAILLRQYPNAAKGIKKLFIMGFRTTDDQEEHNVACDPVAAQKVLESPIPLVVIPSDVCGKYLFPLNLEKERGWPTDAGSYVFDLLKAFIGGKIVVEFEGDKQLTADVKDSRMERGVAEWLGAEKYLKIIDFRSRFFINFDVYEAYLNRDSFLTDFRKIIIQFENPEYRYQNGIAIAHRLRSLLRQRISVADIFVPYCFLYPERTITTRGDIQYLGKGFSKFVDGDRCEVVIGFDAWHFESFLKEYLR